MTRLESRANAMICALTQRLLLLSGDVELNPGPALDLGRFGWAREGLVDSKLLSVFVY